MSIDFNEFPGKFTKLVLSGGGPRGLAILGALHLVDEYHGLDEINEYWGTSIGSVMCLLLYVGYTPFEAFHQFFMLEHIADPEHLNIQDIIQEAAFCPIEVFGNKIRQLVLKKLATNVEPTFHDLYIKFGKKIHIIGTNVDTMKGECFDVDTNPLMSVIEAIEISCDLPYIFTKKKYNNNTYVDGGFINDYPVNLADNGTDYCLGVCVFGDTNISGSDYIGWIYRLLRIPIMELYRERTSRLSNRFTNIELQINNVSMLEMSPDNKKKIDIFSAGYQQAKLQFLKLNSKYLRVSSRLEYLPTDEEELMLDTWFSKDEWDKIPWETLPNEK